METVTLHGWYAHAVHCPYCGTPDGDDGCDHLLFAVIDGEFAYQSERLVKFFKETDKEISIDELDFQNYVVFERHTPSDIQLIGFACFDDEISAWGREHVDPTSRRPNGKSQS